MSFYFDVRRMWPVGIYEGSHSSLKISFEEFWVDGVGCFTLALTYVLIHVRQFSRKVYTDNFIEWIH